MVVWGYITYSWPVDIHKHRAKACRIRSEFYRSSVYVYVIHLILMIPTVSYIQCLLYMYSTTYNNTRKRNLRTAVGRARSFQSSPIYVLILRTYSGKSLLACGGQERTVAVGNHLNLCRLPTSIAERLRRPIRAAAPPASQSCGNTEN